MPLLRTNPNIGFETHACVQMRAHTWICMGIFVSHQQSFNLKIMVVAFTTFMILQNGWRRTRKLTTRKLQTQTPAQSFTTQNIKSLSSGIVIIEEVTHTLEKVVSIEKFNWMYMPKSWYVLPKIIAKMRLFGRASDVLLLIRDSEKNNACIMCECVTTMISTKRFDNKQTNKSFAPKFFGTKSCSNSLLGKIALIV